MRPAPAGGFVPARGDAPVTPARSRKPKRPAPGPLTRAVRKRASGFPWRTWLVRLAVAAAVVLAVVGLFAPNGTLIVGCVLMGLGSSLVLLGYAAGAFGAFSEDFLYGFLYIVV